MRASLNFLLLLSIAIALISCSSETDTSWTLTGHLIKIHPDSRDQQSVEATNLPPSAASDDSVTVDLSSASISITHQETNEASESITVELASGTFRRWIQWSSSRPYRQD